MHRHRRANYYHGKLSNASRARLGGYVLLREEVIFAQPNGCVGRNMGYNFGADLPVNYAAASVDNLIGDNRRNLRLHTT